MASRNATSGAASSGRNGGIDSKTTRSPTSSFVRPLLTDLYQLTMAYAYWCSGRHEEHAVFDCFFRKNPFKGEYTHFAGLSEVIALLDSFEYTESDVAYLKTVMPNVKEGFFEWIATLDCSRVKVYALKEGSVAFPRIPLLRVEGPLAICQLLETTILNLTNFASLVMTNAARMRRAAGYDKTLLEFGLRRAQGPDGALSASRYAYYGGFDGTSNLMAGKTFGINAKGTHAHAFVCSYSSPDQIPNKQLNGVDFWELVNSHRKKNGWMHTNEGELAAFVAYALAFPHGFLALVDTYDTLQSGVPNFLAVALALQELGYKPLGIRLDSGDLAYLSRKARAMFQRVAQDHALPSFEKFIIVASNDINENVLNALNEQGHSIDAFGIGTNLVTCQAQPALGMVFKLVEVNGKPAVKLSNDFVKATLPSKKKAFRIVGREGKALLDVLMGENEASPEPGRRLLCRHPFIERKRVYVTPAAVIPLLECVWDGPNGGPTSPETTSEDVRKYASSQLKLVREDHLRSLNPTPYKVSVSDELYRYVHELWMDNVPIPDLG